MGNQTTLPGSVAIRGVEGYVGRMPTEDERQQFLARVAGGMSQHEAARELGLSWLAFGKLLVNDESFAADLEVARTLRVMALEEIAVQQCTVGIDEPLTHQGRITYDYKEGEYELDEGGNVLPGATRTPVTVKKLVTNNAMLLALIKSRNAQFNDKSEVHVIPKQAQLDPRDASSRDKLLEAMERSIAERVRARDAAKPDPAETEL